MTVLVGAAASDVGRVRAVNQDGALSSPFLFAVADGMGGHRGGEVASALALRTLGGRARYRDAGEVVAAVEQANRVVHGASQDDPNVRGMGTTLCAVALVDQPAGGGTVTGAGDGGAARAAPEPGRDERLVVVNVGDSRAYRLAPGGELEQLTVDHSLVQMLVDEGQITAEEAEHHPQRNIVTRVLGIEATVEVDVWELDVVHGERFLICSDGLFGEVEAGRMAVELRRWADPREAARQLVDLANAAGGRDNITCAIFDVLDDDDPGAVARPTAQATLRGSPEAGPDGGGEPSPPPARDAGGQGPAAEQARGVAAPTTLVERLALEPAADADADADAEDTVQSPRAPAAAAPVPPGEPGAGAPARPRRFTVRVVLFLLAVAVVLALAALAIGWYATRTYFVGAHDGDVVIFQGRPGGVLWFEPTLAETSELRVADLGAQACDVVRSQPSATDLDDARAIVERLRGAPERASGAAPCEAA